MTIEGVHDAFEGVHDAYDRIERVYGLYDAADACDLRVADTDHAAVRERPGVPAFPCRELAGVAFDPRHRPRGRRPRRRRAPVAALDGSDPVRCFRDRATDPAAAYDPRLDARGVLDCDVPGITAVLEDAGVDVAVG